MSKYINDPTVAKALEKSHLRDVDPQPHKRKPWWKPGGKDYSFVTVNDGYPESTVSSNFEYKNNSTDTLGSHHNVYNSSATKKIYKPIEGYEGAHRFDPSLNWEPGEESKLVKHVCPSRFAMQSLRNSSLTGASPCLHALCSLLSNWIVETLFKLFLAPC